nr:MAG TPA: hypothetical protein [Caudoviricetes sp.]
MKKNTGREFFRYSCYTIWIIESKISKKYLKNVHCWGAERYGILLPSQTGKEVKNPGWGRQNSPPVRAWKAYSGPPTP